MIIEKGDVNVFSGITIELETKEEAEMFWHIFNINNEQLLNIWNNRSKDRIKPDYNRWFDLRTIIFKCIDKLFEPEKLHQ